MMKIFFIIMLLSIAILSNGCDPGGRLIIENNRSEELRIDIYDIILEKLYGPVPMETVPAKTRKDVGGITYTQGRDQMFRIEARSTSGEVVFSKDLTAQDLINMNWTVTIRPE